MLLGPFQATIDGRSLESFRTSKVQALLIYLLVQAVDLPAVGVGREQLMALLWPQMPRKSAQENLRQALYHLRQTIPEVAGSDGVIVPFIQSDRQRVQINPDARYRLDVATFTSLVGKDGREQLPTAVDLYRGDFLADFYLEDSSEFENWAAEWRGRLKRQVLDVLDRLAAHYLERGEPDQAAIVARRMMEIDNLRESGHRHLMVALSRMGKRAEAIRQYERCRLLLQEQLGVEPAAETEAVVTAIRRRGLAGRRGRRLPIPETPIIGREAEIGDIVTLLEGDARLVSIVGPGGIGKTRLALEVAHRMTSESGGDRLDESRSVNRVSFVNLAPLSESADLVPAMTRALNLEFEKGDREGLKRRLLAYLRGKDFLLILDNFEHLLDGATLLKEILRAAPEVKLLVTSRERLRLQAEHVYLLAGLSYSHWTTPVEASRDPAVQLFQHHARRVRPAFTLRNRHLQPLREIVELTDGTPLALILAAGWVPVLELDEIAAEIGRNLDFLKATHRDVPPRQQSMSAVFEAMWERLGAGERALFAGLSVFRGGFTLDAARAVTGAKPGDLIRLTDHSLIARAQGGRFEIHELLRQFAWERLQEAGQTDTVCDAHSRYYLSILAALLMDLKGSGQLKALDAIGEEFENIRVGWRRAIERGEWLLIAAASESLHLFARIRSRYLEGVELFEVARRGITLDGTSSVQLASAYVTAGRQALLDTAGLTEEALASVPELYAILDTLSNPHASAFCHLTLGEVLYSGGRFEDAFEELAAALVYYQQEEDLFFVAIVLLLLGWSTQATGQPEKALDLAHYGLALARQAGDHYVTAALLRTIGGLIRMLDGPTKTVESNYREAADLRLEIGARMHYASNLAELANIFVWRDGDVERARPLLEEAMAIAEEQNVSYVRTKTLTEFTTHRLIEGKYNEALVLTGEVLELASSHGPTWTWASFQRGIAFLALGDMEGALRFMKAALSRMIEREWSGFMRSFLPFCGIILHERGEHERAAELLAFGLTHPHAPGRLAIDPLITQFRAELEETLGEECFASVWERGKGLDTLTAAAEVLEELEG